MFRRSNTHRLQSDNRILIRLFVVFASVCLFLSAELAILSNGASIRDSLFWNGTVTDHFMDFFNTLRDTHDLTWVYQRGTIYPPFSVLVMYLLSRFISPGLAALMFDDRLTMQRSQNAVMLYFFFAAVCVLLLSLFAERCLACAGYRAERYVLIVFCVVSFPMIYCLERGNTSLLTVVFSAYFVFFRNAEGKVTRELAYLALAVAAGLKMFPAVLGVLLLYDKKWFAAARTILYGVAFFVIPYLIVKALTPETGGIAQAYAGVDYIVHEDGSQHSTDGSLARFVANVAKWSGAKGSFTYNSTSILNLLYLFNRAEWVSYARISAVAPFVFLLSELVAFIAGFLCKKEWQKVFFATYLMLNIHPIAMFYTLIYIIPVFILFLGELRGTRSRLNGVYLFLMSLLIVPLPYLLYNRNQAFGAFLRQTLNIGLTGNMNKFLAMPVYQLLALLILLDVLFYAVRHRKAKRAAA